MKVFLLLAAAMLAACNPASNERIQVLIGGKLIDRPGAAPLEHSVVIVEDTKFRAVGSQVHTPIPPASVKVDASPYTVRGTLIEAGAEANLELVDAQGQVSRRMVAGKWQ